MTEQVKTRIVLYRGRGWVVSAQIFCGELYLMVDYPDGSEQGFQDWAAVEEVVGIELRPIEE